VRGLAENPAQRMWRRSAAVLDEVDEEVEVDEDEDEDEDEDGMANARMRCRIPTKRTLMEQGTADPVE
jgi:hypothetical protein